MRNNTILTVIEAICGIAIVIGVWFTVYYGTTYRSEANQIGTIVALGNEAYSAGN